MRNRNKVRPALALLLAAAMALTGPAQSITSVQAVEAQESEEAVAGMDSTTVATVDSDSEAVSGVEVSSEQVDTAESVLESAIETSAVKVDEGTDEDVVVQDSQMETDREAVTEEDATEEGTTKEETKQEKITEETTQEITQWEITEETTQEENTEETTQDETESEEEATEEFLMPAANKEDAIALSVNQKEDVIIRGYGGWYGRCSWYSFTPEEDGTYALKMTCDEVDYGYWCETSGLNNSFNIDEKTNKGIFIGKTGETVYFHPYVEYDEWGYEEIESVMVSLTILPFPDKEDVVALSVMKREKFVIEEGEDCSWYSFTPEKDGAYTLSMTCDELDYYDGEYESYSYGCVTSGLNNSFEIMRNTIFLGKAGETVYFQPYVSGYAWNDYEITETTASLKIDAIAKGTASVDSGGKYILSYYDIKIGLDLNLSNTAINLSAVPMSNEVYANYYLGAFCTGMSYNNNTVGYCSNDDDDNDTDFVSFSFKGLDINTRYHVEYVLCINTYDDSDGYNMRFVWFDGTDMPFDICTTDKAGGELHATADFGVINVAYNLVRSDTAGLGGYVRYRKSTEEEWFYEEVYEDEYGSIQFDVESETTYIIELVSKNKNTVYDSVEITTETDNGTVNSTIKAAIREASITANSAVVEVTGFDTEVEHLEIQIEYIDSFDKIQTDLYSFYKSDEDGIPDWRAFSLDNLKAGTEYNNVRIRIESKSYPKNKNYCQRSIYAGQINSFVTKESSIRKQDISFELISVEQQSERWQSAEIKVTVNGIPQDGRMILYGQYRYKDSTRWDTSENYYFSSTSNIRVIDLDYLEPDRDYEIRYNLDGIIGTFEFHCQSIEFTGSVKPEVKVTKTYVNGLELEYSLNGAVDSKDKYTCRFDEYPFYRQEIELDVTKPVKQQFYGERFNPGQKQTGRYIVYQNGSEYYVGYFKGETKPLELEISSIRNTASEISGVCTAINKEDIIIDEYGKANIRAGIQLRKKGQELWKKINYVTLFFYSDGVSYFRLEQRNYPKDLILEPDAEYELRVVGYDDDSIIYGETSFIAEGSWDIESNPRFQYDPKTNNQQYITTHNNFEKPTVEVEDENIVSIREIRQARIGLNIHNIGTTKLYVTADGITREVTVTVTDPSIQDLFYLEGADTSLADIKLPVNYTWVNSTESPKADDENEIQYFDVRIKEGEDIKFGSLPVAVSKLGDIDIWGMDTIGAGKENGYGVSYGSVGYDVNYYGKGTAYEITQQWAGNDNLKISGKDNERDVTVTGGNTAGEYELTLTVTAKNLQSGKSCSAVTKIKKVRVIGAGLMDNLTIQPAKEQPSDAVPYTVSGSVIDGRVVSGSVIVVDYDDYDPNQKSKIQMEAKTDTGTDGMKDADVSWENVSTDILEINDTGLVTIKDTGEGKIRATTKDGSEISRQIIFKIRDNAPVFDTTSFVVRQGNKEGAQLSFHAEACNLITEMKIMDENSQLEVKRGRTWYLCVKEGITLTGEKIERITLEMTSERQKKYYQTVDVTILPMPKADKTTAVLKQTIKPNLFYVNSEAVFTVTGIYDIENIRTRADDREKENFHVKQYDSNTGILTLTANELSSSNVGAYTSKNSANAIANIEIKFKGYDEYVPFNNLRVAVQNKAASLKAEDAFVTEKSENALISVLSGKDIYDISGSAIEIVSVTPANQKDNFQVAVNNGQLQLTYKGTGTAKYKLKVTNPNWTKDINLSGKVVKVDVSRLSLKATKTKAILNTKYQETVKADFSVKGNDSLPVTLNYSCTPQADALKVEVTGNKTVTVRVDQDKTILPRKYTIKVWGEIDGIQTKKTNLAVTVTDKEPTIKLSAKGSINIANRDFSEIVYTVAIKNTDAEVSKVEITDDNILRFSIKKNSGRKLSVKALKNAKNLEKNKKYPVRIRIMLSNGSAQELTVTVKPVNKLPKITVNAPKSPTIAPDTNNPIWVKLATEKGYRIDKVALVDGKGSENFILTMAEQNTFSIRLADNNSEIASKTYTIKYQIYITGADNSKPVTKSIKVAVKN